MSTDLDVAVIGGGLLGAAIGYGLADGRRRIAIFDEGDRAFRASRGNFGLVWVQGKGIDCPEYAHWTRRSAALWPELAAMLRADTGIDVALEQPGGLHLCLSEDEADQRAEMVRRSASLRLPASTSVAEVTAPASGSAVRDAGVATSAGSPRAACCNVEMLDHAAAAKLVPGLGRDVVAASYCNLDGHVNPLKLLRALHVGFARRGGRYLAPAAVTNIVCESGGFTLQSERGRFAAARVVISAGLGTGALAAQVGVRAPLRAQRGHVIALQRMERFLHHPVDTLRQTDEGTVLIGDSQQEAGLDDSLSTGVLAAMAGRAVRCVPALSSASVNRAWAALRVLTPDGMPLYQASASHGGAFVVTSHSGVTLAAVHALRLAPQIGCGELERNLHVFSGERFAIPVPAAA